MRLILLADVHANLEALQAVLADAAVLAPGAQVVCAGDVLGYGPDPEPCVWLLVRLGATFVLGNHEEMVLGRRSFDRCTHAGIRAALFTRGHISEHARTLVEGWPHFAHVHPGVVVCHGDLASADHYVSNAAQARRALRQLQELHPQAELLVCGHTHHAMSFSERRGLEEASGCTERELPAGERVLLNPGAVGQSRDERALARYAVLDLATRHVQYRALEYDHAATLAKLRRARLVPRVVMPPPRGFARRMEHWRTRWVRSWAARQVAAAQPRVRVG